jgi:two-component system sensor histidine kinase MtrB
MRFRLTWWRRSLAVRVIASTLLASTLAMTLLGLLLLGRVTDGLLLARQQAALSESSAGLADAQSIVASSGTGPSTSSTVLADNIVTALSARAGQPALYEVLLLAAPTARGSAPERGTNLVLENSVPKALRKVVATSSHQAWTYTTIRYLNGRAVTGLAVGAPLLIPDSGTYELYHLYPLDQEQQTIDLVRSAVLVTGALLTILLSVIAWVVTSQVVAPIRAAAMTAERLASGRLTERLAIRGEDDLARLAISFNEMAAALQEQIRRLETLSRLQQRFVSDVSHELRTPLTTVRMAADMLYDTRGTLDDASARAAELLQMQLDRFESLLADLLEISRFDAGAASLDVERTDITATTRSAVAALESIAAQHGSSINLSTQTEATYATVDERRVTRILRNLIANAIEHGEGRPIDVSIASDEEVVAVTVRDFGLGLKPGEASLVFNRFWRADPSRRRSMGGTGLGLSISYEDARLHGGWLDAWGAPGRGANFRLVLPREAGADVTHGLLPLDLDEVGGAT